LPSEAEPLIRPLLELVLTPCGTILAEHAAPRSPVRWRVVEPSRLARRGRSAQPTPGSTDCAACSSSPEPVPPAVFRAGVRWGAVCAVLPPKNHSEDPGGPAVFFEPAAPPRISTARPRPRTHTDPRGAGHAHRRRSALFEPAEPDGRAERRWFAMVTTGRPNRCGLTPRIVSASFGRGLPPPSAENKNHTAGRTLSGRGGGPEPGASGP